MIPIISLVTSVKDYIEVVHKLIESDSNYAITDYNELGSIITYSLISLKNSITDFLSLNWRETIWNLPVMIPEISSAMVSEISVLDGYFHNTFNFLDTPLSYGPKNGFIYGLEKFVIGLINSCFLIIPTSTAHIITLRRFVMQGLEAGYIAGIGTIVGNIFWIGSIVLGCRFFVIPWVTLYSPLGYLLGFMLLVKYMWDSYNEKRMVLEDLSKQKIFFLNFLLALTEQTNIYPFLSNLTIGPESSILESFPADNYPQFLFIHICYLLGLLVGSFSLLHFTCWFWENPAFKLYMWVISSFKVSTGAYSKFFNFFFLYLTMICAITSVPYYGIDYTITNPLGFVSDDRIIDQKLLPEVAFLNSKASDKNTRRNRGRHGRRERWKRRVRKYRTFDASLYDQGVYDLFTIEDLNYGFDRFWLRRKMRNHRVRFRFFPGPWMRSFKKQLSKPRLESYAGPRQEFFRILFEQVYHPSFHKYNYTSKNKKDSSEKNIPLNTKTFINSKNTMPLASTIPYTSTLGKKEVSIYSSLNGQASSTKMGNSDSISMGSNQSTKGLRKENLIHENSTLRKFVRKVNSRMKTSDILNGLNLSITSTGTISSSVLNKELNQENKSVYSKRWKEIFSKVQNNNLNQSGQFNGFLQNFYTNSLSFKSTSIDKSYNDFPETKTIKENKDRNIKKENSRIDLSKKDYQILRYKKALFTQENQQQQNDTINKSTKVLLHPLTYYLKKEQAFQSKLNYYTPTVFRKFSVENNAPYFRTMMKRYFYYYKPTLRWEKTMKVASLRKARRKKSRTPRKLQFPSNSTEGTNSINVNSTSQTSTSEQTLLSPIPIGFTEQSGGKPPLVMLSELSIGLRKPTSTYTIVGKRASRYRYQIYKDVLQHWYYSPFNRFLVKLDVDAFIRRQPNSHFLTKNEENLIHLRRFLLSEHYNTLRWYTYMQHYRSMKTKIGGTKSFSSGVYNQQFQGTFKKIRHLFAITPSQNENTVLKFDQPLYNESYNTSNKKYFNTFLIHEELFDSYNKEKSFDDLVGQSTQIIREYLVKATPIRQEILQKLIAEHNYSELTQFLYKGQKTRGTEPITNSKALYSQEQKYLLTAKEELHQFEKEQFQNFLKNNRLNSDLWVNLLKKWKRHVNDQEFLKNYISRRVEKREKRKQKKEKTFQKKLGKLTNWLASVNPESNFSNPSNIINKEKTLSSGIQKAVNEGITSINQESTDNSFNKVEALLMYKNKLMNSNWVESKNQQSMFLKGDNMDSNSLSLIQTKLNVENLRFYSQLKKEKEIQTSLSSIQQILNKMDKKKLSLLKRKQKSINLKGVLNKTSNLILNYQQKISQYLGIRKLSSFLLPIKQKSLNNWRKKERALNKQKKSRKELKSLSQIVTKKKASKYKNDYYFNTSFDSSNNNSNLRKKRDDSVEENSQKWTDLWSSNYPNKSSYLTKEFKRKKSPQRRARIRRSRGVTKKRTLADSLKREFRNLRRYGEKVDSDSKKQQILEKINNYSFTGKQTKFSPQDQFDLTGQKQRRSKQRKQRTWKQKRSKYSQKLRKYKKRRRNVLGKIRILSKQLKRIQSKVQIQNWWWKNFLPSIRANTDALWQIEKDKQIREKLQDFSVSEILKRDRINNPSFVNSNLPDGLQIGDKDFKPLALPQAMVFKENLYPSLNNSKDLEISKMKDSSILSNNNSSYNNLYLLGSSSTGDSTLSSKQVLSSPTLKDDLIGKISEKALLSNTFDNLQKNNKQNEQSSFLTSTTTIPFYAGWDESLRKFVVTNRLLSRQRAGFEMNLNNKSQSGLTIPGLNPLISTLNKNENIKSSLDKDSQSNTNLEFTAAPLKGMNAATTLYWQIPFTTYDPDQFFSLGMDGFAPIGWRRFQFRHTILKSWLYYLSSSNSNSILESQQKNSEKKVILVKGKTTFSSFSNEKNSTTPDNKTNKEQKNPLIYKLNNQVNNKLDVFGKANDSPSLALDFKDKKMAKNISRRLKKRNKRVKKHPRAPVWFPSGPLLNQVLPVHYIYVFYKRSRVPRDRYLKRRLQNIKGINKGKEVSTNREPNNGPLSPSLVDYTLRKRVKTKRKYHRKKDLSKKMPIFPRRVKFLGEDMDSIHWRPMSRQKLNKPIGEFVREQRLIRNKQQRKELNKGNKQPSLRVKQLRRRVQRQIIRSVWRYKPRAGGFVWPGDYLRLELVKAPKLQLGNFKEGKIKQDKDETNISKAQPMLSKLSITSVGSPTLSKTKRKKKRALQEWQIQPKKYLYEKHNIRVLKKKLEKANQSVSSLAKLKKLTLLKQSY